MKPLLGIITIILLALTLGRLQSSINPGPPPKPVLTTEQLARQKEQSARESEAFVRRKQEERKKELDIYKQKTRTAKHWIHDDSGRLMPGETELNDHWFHDGKPGVEGLRWNAKDVPASAAWPRPAGK